VESYNPHELSIFYQFLNIRWWFYLHSDFSKVVRFDSDARFLDIFHFVKKMKYKKSYVMMPVDDFWLLYHYLFFTLLVVMKKIFGSTGIINFAITAQFLQCYMLQMFWPLLLAKNNNSGQNFRRLRCWKNWTQNYMERFGSLINIDFHCHWIPIFIYFRVVWCDKWMRWQVTRSGQWAFFIWSCIIEMVTCAAYLGTFVISNIIYELTIYTLRRNLNEAFNFAM